MNRKDRHRELSADLALALKVVDGPPSPGEHPDDLALAAYVDGRLAGRRRRALETHLAACDNCRELASITAAASDAAGAGIGASEPRRSWRWPRPRPAWAGAGILALVALVPTMRWLGVGGINLDVLGVDAAERTAASSELLDKARRLASGKIGPTPKLEGLALADPGALRAGDLFRPEPLLPRWSAVVTPRPRFDWSAPDDADGLELLVVDVEERLVGAAILPAGEAASSYPENLPDLEPGGLYAWRVSARVGDEWLASSFVPFRVLAPEELEALNHDLASAGDDPLLRAAAYLTAGVDREGLGELSAAVHQTEEREMVLVMVNSILRRQVLPPELARRRASALLGGPTN